MWEESQAENTRLRMEMSQVTMLIMLMVTKVTVLIMLMLTIVAMLIMLLLIKVAMAIMLTVVIKLIMAMNMLFMLIKPPFRVLKT